MGIPFRFFFFFFQIFLFSSFSNFSFFHFVIFESFHCFSSSFFHVFCISPLLPLLPGPSIKHRFLPAKILILNAPKETSPFHNRTHRTFLLIACVETPHSNKGRGRTGRKRRSLCYVVSALQKKRCGRIDSSGTTNTVQTRMLEKSAAPSMTKISKTRRSN